MTACVIFSGIMRGFLTLVSILMLWLMDSPVFAQTIQGQIVDAGDGKPVEDVTVQNIHTNDGINTDESGKFVLPAAKGQLIEFHKIGYKVIRVRLPMGNMPPYFKVVMEKGNIELPGVDVAGGPKDYASDSAKYYKLYKKELEFPKMTAVEKVRSPFSAMSKKNQQIWHFQKEFEWFQQQKYIDYTFNEKLITTITGLKGDSAQAYIRMFRPTYSQLKSMNEYTYYNYIKTTVQAYRMYGPRARMGRSRSTN